MINKLKEGQTVNLEEEQNRYPYCLVCKMYITEEQREKYAETYKLDQNICSPEHQEIKYISKAQFEMAKAVKGLHKPNKPIRN